MNLTHLRYALEVERTRSITKAAQNLYMGQPNLSKAIKELEGEIGIPIFSRTSKGVGVTKKGAEFLHYARGIVEQVQELESIYKPNNQKSVKCNFSVPRASYISVAFTDFLTELEKKDELSIYFKETSSLEAINDVAEREADLAIIRFQDAYEEYFRYILKEKDLVSEPVWQFTPLVLFDRDHSLAQMKEITFSQLADCTEIIHGDDTIPSLSMDSVKESQPFTVSDKRIYVYERGSQFDILTRVKGAYMWVSPVPETTLTQYGLVQRSCLPTPARNQDIAVYQRGHGLSTYERRFLEMVRRRGIQYDETGHM